MKNLAIDLGVIAVVASLFALVPHACAQSPQPPSVETRLDQCNAERGTLITEAARLNFQLRESTSALTANGFEVHEGKWIKKAEPKKDEPKK